MKKSSMKSSPRFPTCGDTRSERQRMEDRRHTGTQIRRRKSIGSKQEGTQAMCLLTVRGISYFIYDILKACDSIWSCFYVHHIISMGLSPLIMDVDTEVFKLDCHVREQSQVACVRKSRDNIPWKSHIHSESWIYRYCTSCLPHGTATWYSMFGVPVPVARPAWPCPVGLSCPQPFSAVSTLCSRDKSKPKTASVISFSKQQIPMATNSLYWGPRQWFEWVTKIKLNKV